MDQLVTRLSQADSPVLFDPRRDEALAELKDEVDRGYVHIKFTETQGGTELGFDLDDEKSDLTGADWDAGQGSIHLEGELNLNGVDVRCVVDLDLGTIEGSGRLEIQ